MIFKSESIPSLFIHALTDIKLKNDDPLKIWFDAIEWTPIHDKCFHLYSDTGAPAYNPVSMFKALLLIYLGQALSERHTFKTYSTFYARCIFSLNYLEILDIDSMIVLKNIAFLLLLM